MLKIGATDVFERDYTQKFRTFAARFGEFIAYERDRGARDLGLHLTHRLSSGMERLSTALCWFQLKGVMTTTLSAEEFDKASGVKLSLDVGHLRYWFLQPVPTHLVVYVECKDLFLITNIQDYVAKHWGKDVLTLNQATVTVTVPKDSVLDDQAFSLILIRSDVKEWAKALEADEKSVQLCRRDYDLIWHFGTAQERDVIHRVRFLDWQSKTRAQFYIQERHVEGKSDWTDLREHWQFMMSVFDLEQAYPYLEFFSVETAEDAWMWDDDDDDDNPEVPKLTLTNGDTIHGANYAYEYFHYVMGARLNALGRQLFELVTTLAKIGLIGITPGKKESISIAPWHRRDI